MLKIQSMADQTHVLVNILQQAVCIDWRKHETDPFCVCAWYGVSASSLMFQYLHVIVESMVLSVAMICFVLLLVAAYHDRPMQCPR